MTNNQLGMTAQQSIQNIPSNSQFGRTPPQPGSTAPNGSSAFSGFGLNITPNTPAENLGGFGPTHPNAVQMNFGLPPKLVVDKKAVKSKPTKSSKPMKYGAGSIEEIENHVKIHFTNDNSGESRLPMFKLNFKGKGCIQSGQQNLCIPNYLMLGNGADLLFVDPGHAIHCALAVKVGEAWRLMGMELDHKKSVGFYLPAQFSVAHLYTCIPGLTPGMTIISRE